jgi:threonine 3-dehydrogenase
MMMDALVKSYDKQGLWIEKVPVPEIGINDVLIKIIKTSICGTQSIHKELVEKIGKTI